MHLLVGLFVFFSIAFAQQVLQEDEEQTLNKVCKKSVIELAFSGNILEF